MRLDVEQPEPGRVRVRVHGEIDSATAPVLAAALGRELAAEPLRTLVLDLAGTTFLSAAGLTVLLDTRATATATGRAVVLDAVSPMIRRVLRVARLDRVLAAGGPSDGEETEPDEGPPGRDAVSDHRPRS